ncbi:uncharacterized protein BDZ99DRAFT_522837 [Mytilinidion resinicola]|uniref:Uncharacterized protein n=1 Tax=Mytilinidion resinicola TaxID=574789 RepID=A0A6A6YH40_9PEZI|nr:uncharacterized protein BDZ99DRAFT_522837 [Mytilinidion resinicola]KAF2807217.1 hypothetical protein BDZ99DRAFT_522837 [Mytilinidion resinicola]
MSELELLVKLFPLDHEYKFSVHEVTFKTLPSTSTVSTKISTQNVSVQSLCEGPEDADHPKPEFAGQRGNGLRYRWYHASQNNLDWAESLISKLLPASDVARFRRMMSDREESIRHVSQMTRSIRLGCESICREGIYSASSHAAGYNVLEGKSRHQSAPGTVALFMPFLGWDDASHLCERHKALEMLVSDAVPQSVQEAYASVTTHPKRRFKAASVTASKPLQLPSTLDQYQFPSSATSSGFARSSKRLQDQAVPRRTKHTMTAPKALVVNQLWLFSIGNDTVITFFPGCEKPFVSDNKNYPLEETIKTRLAEIVSPMEACSDVHSLCTLIIQGAVNLITETSQSRGFELIECYRNSVSSLRQEYMQALATFRDEALNQSPNSRSLIKADSTWARIFDVSTMLDEILVLQEVYKTQLNVLDTFGTTIWGENWKDLLFDSSSHRPGLARLFETRGKISDFLSNFNTLQASLLHNKADWLNLLDLHEKRASLQEARSAVKQAEETGRQTEASLALAESAAKQNRVMMIFTFMTVIFVSMTLSSTVIMLTGPGKSASAFILHIVLLDERSRVFFGP